MKKIENNSHNHCEYDDHFLEAHELTALAEKFGTPMFIYDEKGLRSRARSLLSVFGSAVSMQYFPVEKCPVPQLLRVLREEGMGALCQTPGELQLAMDCGFPGERILYGTTVVSRELSHRLCQLNCILLAGSPLTLEYELPERVLLLCRRPDHREKRHAFARSLPGIGFTADELAVQIPVLYSRGVRSVGLSLRYDGNVTKEDFLPNWIRALEKTAASLTAAGARVDMLHMTGGLGVRYHRVDMQSIDPSLTADALQQIMAGSERSLSLSLGTLFAEPCGIFVMGVLAVIDRLGALVTTDVRPEDVLLEPLERYHHISLCGQTQIQGRRCCDIVSYVPSFGGWIGKDRLLPLPKAGDLLVLHDAGCSRPQYSPHAALLKREDGSIVVLQHGKKQQGAHTDAQGSDHCG